MGVNQREHTETDEARDLLESVYVKDCLQFYLLSSRVGR